MLCYFNYPPDNLLFEKFYYFQFKYFLVLLFYSKKFVFTKKVLKKV